MQHLRQIQGADHGGGIVRFGSKRGEGIDESHDDGGDEVVHSVEVAAGFVDCFHESYSGID